MAAPLIGCKRRGNERTASLFTSFPAGCRSTGRGPDGNTVVLDAPKGLIVVDTGRSPMHAQAILDYAKARHRPIAAIVNTHWHLDHTTGNYDIRQVYPKAEVFASTAIEGALVGFLNKGRAQGDKMLADPKTTEGQRAQMLRGRYRIDHPDTLRPTRPIVKSGRMSIGGRALDVHLAKFAATEGDVWIYDPKSRTAIVGDLVVGLVPFMDTACADGWSRALAEIAVEPFKTLIPGHGAPMDRADFRPGARRTTTSSHAVIRARARSNASTAGCRTRRSSSTKSTATMLAAQQDITSTGACARHRKSNSAIASRLQRLELGGVTGGFFGIMRG